MGRKASSIKLNEEGIKMIDTARKKRVGIKQRRTGGKKQKSPIRP